ncbi:hypothetical protein ACFWZY_16965 [Streptomyces sp. NPDC058992]|uniref:hypothetical protein n=1 Tax=Streptomyces sp. NPDC058992 TaxID=3346688 RepID=UPI0036CCCBCF
MSEPFANTVLSVTAAPPGFSVVVHHCETPEGGREKVVERYAFPVIAWAVVKRTDWSDGREDTRVEPVFLHNGRPTHTSDYRYMHSDLTPEPGEPKRTVGVVVGEPIGYVIP